MQCSINCRYKRFLFSLFCKQIHLESLNKTLIAYLGTKMANSFGYQNYPELGEQPSYSQRKKANKLDNLRIKGFSSHNSGS